MFIQTENTPNPNAVKFYPGFPVSPHEPMHFARVEEPTNKSSLVVLMFKIHGVEAVFLGENFITITKSKEVLWDVLKPSILMAMTDHFSAGNNVLDMDTHFAHSKDFDKDGLSPVERQIVEIIETRVRPSVAMDGGDIVYQGFENGVVKLLLRGSCSGCPSSSITLKQGIESMLKHFVPEVESVEAVNDQFI